MNIFRCAELGCPQPVVLIEVEQPIFGELPRKLSAHERVFHDGRTIQLTTRGAA